MAEEKELALFENSIRRTWHEGEWHFSIIDAITALTDSSVPRRYWSDLKQRLAQEGFQLYDKIVQLKLTSTSDGKQYLTDCTNTETMLRIVQSIPSPRAEPFKVWLARVGYERIQETRDPSLAIDRAVKQYKRKGYSEQWIGQRLRALFTRKELTDEWQSRQAQGKEYGILTNSIYEATFGKNTKEYRRLKGLGEGDNLRDHMDNLELAITNLAEAATTRVTQKNNSQGYIELKQSAEQGGGVAGKAREEAEVEQFSPT